MRLTKFNTETGQYEYIETAKTQAEFNAQRKAVIQRLGEFEDKASDLAEEIFAEMESTIKGIILLLSFSYNDSPKESYLKKACYKDMLGYIAELKKKYIGKDINVTTNTED